MKQTIMRFKPFSANWWADRANEAFRNIELWNFCVKRLEIAYKREYPL